MLIYSNGFKVSSHAFKRFLIRGGNMGSLEDILSELKTFLNVAIEMPFEKVKNYFDFSYCKRKQMVRYVVAYSSAMRENICAVVSKDNTLITFLNIKPIPKIGQ